MAPGCNLYDIGINSSLHSYRDQVGAFKATTNTYVNAATALIGRRRVETLPRFARVGDAMRGPSNYFTNIVVRRKNVTPKTATGVLPRRLPGVLFTHVPGPERGHFGDRYRPAWGRRRGRDRDRHQ